MHLTQPTVSVIDAKGGNGLFETLDMSVAQLKIINVWSFEGRAFSVMNLICTLYSGWDLKSTAYELALNEETSEHTHS